MQGGFASVSTQYVSLLENRFGSSQKWQSLALAKTYQGQPELHQSGACGCQQLSARESVWQEEAPGVDHWYLLQLLQQDCCQLVPSQQVKFHDPVSIAIADVLRSRRLLIRLRFARIGQSK